MIVTLADLLRRAELRLEQTVYAKTSARFQDYPMSLTELYNWQNEDLALGLFPINREIMRTFERYRYTTCKQCLELFDSKQALHRQMQSETDRDALHQLRMKMKQVCGQLAKVEAALRSSTRDEILVKHNMTDDLTLRYKSKVTMDFLENMRQLVPALGNPALDGMADTPLFTTRELVKLARLSGEDIAVEGGPCLYGTDEVSAIFTLQQGTELAFDYNSGVCKNGLNAQMRQTLWEQADEITDISFQNHKDGFSAQEIEEFDCLFSFAKALDASLAISLPDMSYEKYFCAIAGRLRPEVFEAARARYQQVLKEISDLYQQAIALYQQKYQIRRIAVLCKDAGSIYDAFCSGRDRFCKLEQVTTSFEDKRTSLQDYITMPATPYYLWGTRNIIEINSTDEVDAIRKCMKLHSGEVNFYPILLPEKVAQGRRETVFESKRAQKGYQSLETLRARISNI